MPNPNSQAGHIVSLSCACGITGEEAAAELEPHRRGRRVAFDCVAWLVSPPRLVAWRAEPDANAIDMGYELLESAPKVGGIATLSVSFPFWGKVGEPFSCSYFPPLSYLNGLGDHPDEVAQAAIVTCLLREAPATTDRFRQVVVKVVDVMPLTTAASLARGQTLGRDALARFPPFNVATARAGDLLIVRADDSNVDVSGAMLFDMRQERPHLLAEFVSDTHVNYVLVGNEPLGTDAVETLQAILAQSEPN